MTPFESPRDWKDYKLGELLALSNGINADKTAYGRGIPFANVFEIIGNDRLELSDIPGRVTLPTAVLSRYLVRRGDVLFNRSSETADEVGLSSVYAGTAPIVFGGFVFRGRPISSALEPEFSRYAFRNPGVRRQIAGRGQGSIRANVGQRDLKNVTVPLPSCEEQRVIAGVLDDADGHVLTIERLIDKKEAVRQGLMQELLAARSRLPGFTDEWKLVRLADHVYFCEDRRTVSRSAQPKLATSVSALWRYSREQPNVA